MVEYCEQEGSKATLTGKRTDKQVRLRDGRRLGYAEFGDPQGRPVFYFHGWPSSRLDYRVYDPGGVALKVGARIIAPDRPGFGLSDFKPGRRLLDWPDDVIELADALRVHRFAVFGYSGGTPFATACAFKIPERVTTATMVAVASPFKAAGVTRGMARSISTQYWLTRRLPVLYEFMWKQTKPEQVLRSRWKRLPECDATVRSRPDIRRALTEAIVEGRQAGPKGAVQEGSIISGDWGFPLESIAVSVNLWHGGLDKHYPIAMAQHMATVIPGSRANFLSQEGHISIFVNHIEEILREFVA